MAKDDLAQYIRKHNEGQRSLNNQITVALAMYDEEIVPTEDGLKRKELIEHFEDIGEELEYNMGTCLKNLLNIDVVRRWINGPQIFIIHERRDEIVNGEDLEKLVAKEISRLIEDAKVEDQPEPALADGGDDESILEVIASSLGVSTDKVEDELRKDEVPDQMDKLDTAITAIEDSESVEKRGNYGRISFIHNPYRYSLTKKALALVRGTGTIE